MLATEPALTPEVAGFVHQVLCDGRFLDEFTRDPERVADRLGTPLSSRGADAVRHRNPQELFAQAYETRFAPEAVRPHPYIVHNAPNADLGGTVLVGVLVGTLVTGVAAIAILWNRDKKAAKPVEDKSKGAEKKP